MEEYIDVLDENGNPTGKIKERGAAHIDGDWHKVIQIFIINEDQILLQQRSLKKKSDPGKWSSSASGHISAGETSFEAALKEFNEELGITVEKDKMRLVDTFKSPSVRYNKGVKILNNHFVDLYISTQKINIENIKVQEDEVEQVKFYAIDEFKEMFKKRDERLTDTPILFEHLLNEISK
jgi:isopentenyldiphosphate isomerase